MISELDLSGHSFLAGIGNTISLGFCSGVIADVNPTDRKIHFVVSRQEENQRFEEVN